MDGLEQDPTMIVGLYGALELHPWIRAARDAGRLDEDVFSLAVARGEALGLVATGNGGAPHPRWGHNDAGGDWTGDGRPRVVAWLQVQVAEEPGWRLPVLPAAALLGDIADRVGRFALAGLRTRVPLRFAQDDRWPLRAEAAWFGLADPAARADAVVTVWASRAPAALADAAREAAQGAMTVEPAGDLPAGVADRVRALAPAEEEVFMSGFTEGTSFRCTLPEGTVDAAAWCTEVFAEALRGAGVPAALVTVALVP